MYILVVVCAKWEVQSMLYTYVYTYVYMHIPTAEHVYIQIHMDIHSYRDMQYSGVRVDATQNTHTYTHLHIYSQKHAHMYTVVMACAMWEAPSMLLVGKHTTVAKFRSEVCRQWAKT